MPDRMSQPSRAVIFFCKVNGIEYEEIKVHIPKGQHLTPEFEGFFFCLFDEGNWTCSVFIPMILLQQ
ncbi:hypothetical protein ES332_A12G259700v1 [Gossypium tomentosum]|uniref:GST N-terminal domain-containing protein n=1 Tax=Gossypium tomentosum TaxID=34277 RepID=A0A5D2N1D8_GOSTO|nr:hypothetical protein ES332_A12G259700v1 [Gossypium tomentosum]